MDEPRDFLVFLADLEEGPRRSSFALEPRWLSWALADTEATPTETPGQLELELTKTGNEVLVRGRAELEVLMHCSRTLQPMTLRLRPEIFLMLRQQAPEPGARQRPKRERRRDQWTEKGAPARKQGGWAGTPELSEQQAGNDTFVGERLILDPFIREFVLLELPMFPVSSDLPLPLNEATASAPQPSGSEEQPLDPRLAPLAELKHRLSAEHTKE